MLSPGDVVIVGFPGAIATKIRPAVVVSTALYQTHRPDVIVGLLTTNVRQATTPTDYRLQDWSAAQLRQRSAFRSYLLTTRPDQCQRIGRLSQRDWSKVQACLAQALALDTSQEA